MPPSSPSSFFRSNITQMQYLLSHFSFGCASASAEQRSSPCTPHLPNFFPSLAAVASAAQTNACVRWALKASTWLTCGMFALALKNGREAPGMCPATMRALLPQLLPLVVNQTVTAHTGLVDFEAPLYQR
jgi:hypothetical protein